ncbi:hypothetical protein PIB30_079845 [Stylosanthes scabra]|uniref:Uncharacterized protein n=1 Tax=Stylosanthes scabra TaxID=79078 RepID=A0ABU6XTE6_9FABA|nr:hypothetical protein [Stylosanthes scabra]
MASSSRAPKGRKGKQAMRDDDDDNHDPYRFFTNFHEKFFLSYVASKVIIPSTKFKLQKGQYRDVKRQILMRGDVLELRGPLDSETSFNVRKLRSNRDTDAILRDICVERAVWETEAHMNPLKLRHQDLTPLARDSGVDYHALDSGDKVPKGRPITAEVMENIRQPQRHSLPPHQTPQPHQFHEQPFPPSPQYQSQHQEEGEQPAFEAAFEATYEPQSYGWGQLQEDMAKMKQVQMDFYESILARNTEYGVRLQSIERRQSNLERGQELIHQEFANHVKDFSARMDQMHTELKAEKDMTTKMKDFVVGLSLDSRANDMYIHWGLQQCIPNYGPTNLEDIPQIPHKIKDNCIFGKPWHEGLIRPTQPGESLTAPQQQAPPQQAPPEANAPRRENPDSDDE